MHPRLDPAIEDSIGREEQGRRHQERDEYREETRETGEQRRRDRAHDGQHHEADLDHGEAIERVGVLVAGLVELQPDAIEVSDRRDPAAEREEPLDEGRDRSLAERRQQLLVAGVLDVVALETAKRGPDAGPLVELHPDPEDAQSDCGGDGDERECEFHRAP